MTTSARVEREVPKTPAWKASGVEEDDELRPIIHALRAFAQSYPRRALLSTAAPGLSGWKCPKVCYGAACPPRSNITLESTAYQGHELSSPRNFRMWKRGWQGGGGQTVPFPQSTQGGETDSRVSTRGCAADLVGRGCQSHDRHVRELLPQYPEVQVVRTKVVAPAADRNKDQDRTMTTLQDHNQVPNLSTRV